MAATTYSFILVVNSLLYRAMKGTVQPSLKRRITLLATVCVTENSVAICLLKSMF